MESRGLTNTAMAVLGEVDPATISLIKNGKTRASARTIVKLARGLGVDAKRMKGMCEAHWLAAHPEERIPA
jgi:plasmid maintenance system antidote protein VapI